MSEYIVVYRCRKTAIHPDLYLSSEMGTTPNVNLAKRFDSQATAESSAICRALYDHLHLPASVIDVEPEPPKTQSCYATARTPSVEPETVKAMPKGWLALLDDLEWQMKCRIADLERRANEHDADFLATNGDVAAASTPSKTALTPTPMPPQTAYHPSVTSVS